ncbi:MAG: hypothetical protein DMF95_25750, partial [Acidobacteria bacterium]
MALWMVRAGRHGEHEPRFFGDNKVYDDLCDQEHDAEKRLRAMLAGGFKPSNTSARPVLTRASTFLPPQARWGSESRESAFR